MALACAVSAPTCSTRMIEPSCKLYLRLRKVEDLRRLATDHIGGSKLKVDPRVWSATVCCSGSLFRPMLTYRPRGSLRRKIVKTELSDRRLTLGEPNNNQPSEDYWPRPPALGRDMNESFDGALDVSAMCIVTPVTRPKMSASPG
jgi:hypothetical protein